MVPRPDRLTAFLTILLTACGSPAPAPDAGPVLDADPTVMDLAAYCAGQVEALCRGTSSDRWRR